ncbi:MAG: transcriptional repressor [Myxococcota bacterium]|nr:transcriptional repressor [Myxococcota bacterium]
MSEDFIEQLRGYVADNGLKSSRQREIIAEVFFGCEEHVAIDQLLSKAREKDTKISQATVYRTMKLLSECGLAKMRHFQSGQTLYEVSDGQKGHHDHLICLGCGKIIEFVNAKIEQLQHDIAEQHGFELADHRMELYGYCDAAKCAEKKRA